MIGIWTFANFFCPGSLAYAEMKLILSRLIYDFDIELVDESDRWEDQRVYVLWEKRPLMVWLKERK
jgi:cytochrome P450